MATLCDKLEHCRDTTLVQKALEQLGMQHGHHGIVLCRRYVARWIGVLTALGSYIEGNRKLMEAFMALGTRDDSGYGFGMAVRGALLPVLGKVDTRRLLRFDLICSALTSVYFT